MTPKTILVVDDTVSNLKLIDQALRPDFNPVLLTSGALALEYLKKSKPDLIILDVEMPEMNGYETIRRIKGNPMSAEIPVIFFASLPDNQSELRGLEFGAADYVTKPVLPQLLLHRVRMQLELFDHRFHLERLVEEKTEQVFRLKRVTIESLANLAECRDADTGGHIKRTRLYVELLSKALLKIPSFAKELDAETVDNIISSAPLHDIGKMGIPDSILNKPGRLTQEEMEIMKQHVALGEKTLQTAVSELGFSSFLDVALEMCATHHERWDGLGYLHGLAGHAIPISGRIMAVADVYDALVAKRAYKNPMPHEQAVQIIAEGKGTQFDPDVTDVFLAHEKSFAQINRKYQD